MVENNQTLDNNLKCIGEYNPQLKEKLLNLSYLTNDIQLVETDLKEPNLTYNGLPLHSQSGAELEAKELFGQADNNYLCTNVLFGMGIGHLFKEFCENAQGSVILYEPNLEILRVTLELVDFSKELSQKNVIVASDFQEMKQAFKLVYKYKSEVYLLVLDSYKKLYGKEIESTIKEIEILKGTCVEDFNLLKEKGLDFISSVLNNLSYSLEATPLNEFKDIYKGKTAMVVSAGATLDLNIETIKKNRDKVVIFCVGTALKSLISHGIKPDFLNIIELNDCSGQVNGIDLSDMYLILAPYTNTAIQKLNVKQKFSFPAMTTRGAKYWSHLTDIDISEYISKGTVSYDALSSAKMLGFKKIVLVGQDLAFVNNSCYSKTSAYSDLIFDINPITQKPEYKIKDYDSYIKAIFPPGTDITQPWCREIAEKKLKRLNDTLYFVKGISGEMLPTEATYAIFIDLFREFAYYNKNLELINTSMLGAQIDGFENIPLEKALENATPVEKIALPTEFKYDKDTILKNLNKEKNLLEDILKEFDKTKEYIYKYEREFQRRKIVTKDVYKYYDLIAKAYDYVNIEYFEKNPLYQAVTAAESLEIQHYFNSNKGDKNENAKNIYPLLKTFFQEGEKKIVKIHDEIENQIGIIGGRCETL